MANGDWFYARNNQQQGPVALAALQDLVRTGQLQASDLVWREGMPNWLPAAQVPDLFAGQARVPPPAAPQTGWQPQAPAPYPQPGVGTPYYGGGPGYASAGKSYNGMAVTSFVLSLVGLLFCGVILGIVAIILGVVAMNGMKASGNPQGRGLSIAGIIIGVIDIVAGIVIVIVFMSRAAHNAGGGF
jgi:hypothetical protein